MIRPTRTWRAAAVLAAATLVLTACGSDSDSGSGDKSSSDSKAAAKGDGTLTIGTLLPQTGDLAFLGPPEFAGVQTAVDDINAAGGVLDKDVVQVKADSGDGTPDIAGAQTDKLLDANADAVVGAASSSVSLSVIDKITGAGVVQFSPANTSPALDDAKTDPKNLYFRTAPSDVLQGAVMANTLIEDGKNNVAILARQDSYGELLAAQIDKGVKAGGGNVVTKQLYSADATNYTAEVNKVAASKPDAIVLVELRRDEEARPGAHREGCRPAGRAGVLRGRQHGRLLEGLQEGHPHGHQGHPPGCRAQVGLPGALLETDPKLKDFTYGPESYDATVLTALAAISAKSDDPKTFAPEIIKNSEGGTACTTFKECAELAKKGEDIDYNGLSGPIELGKTGSPTKATIGIYKYGPDNTYKSFKYTAGVI